MSLIQYSEDLCLSRGLLGCDAMFQRSLIPPSSLEVFWVMTSCSFVVGYQRFRVPCCLHLHGEG